MCYHKKIRLFSYFYLMQILLGIERKNTLLPVLTICLNNFDVETYTWILAFHYIPHLYNLNFYLHNCAWDPIYVFLYKNQNIFHKLKSKYIFITTKHEFITRDLYKISSSSIVKFCEVFEFRKFPVKIKFIIIMKLVPLLYLYKLIKKWAF